MNFTRAAIFAASLASGCVDQDPLGLSRRTLIEPYVLEKSEGDIYYIQKSGSLQNGGGFLEGTVEEIGWTNGFIFARRSGLMRGDPANPDGWMIIDVTKGKLSGPINDSQFRSNHPLVTTYSAKIAWDKL